MSNINNPPTRTSPRFSKSNNSASGNVQSFTNDYNQCNPNNIINSDNNNISFNFINGVVESSSPSRGQKRTCSTVTNIMNYCSFDDQALLALAQGGPFDPNNMQLYIQKLDMLYRNLEERVEKLEHIVARQLLNANDGSNAHINNAAGPFNIAEYSNTGSTSSSSTINSVISASNLPRTMNSCSPRSTSTINSLLEPVTKEVAKYDLDDYCLPLLQRRATPSIGELNSIVMNLKKLKYPDLDNKFILSKVREWFRRKREYMSQRIFNTCTKKFGNLTDDPMSVVELTHKARNNPIFVAEIAREANLEIVNDATAWEFCSEKILTYLENLPSNRSTGTFPNQF